MFKTLILWFFGHDSPRKCKQGKILKNFLGVLPRKVDEQIDVDWLPGCNMSYRREALESIEIPKHLEGYSQGEDRVISHQVKQAGWRLVCTPAARIQHLHAQTDKEFGKDAEGHSQSYRRGFSEAFHNYKHWARYMPHDVSHTFMVWWMLIGYPIINILRLKWRRAGGNLAAIRKITRTIKGRE